MSELTTLEQVGFHQQLREVLVFNEQGWTCEVITSVTTIRKAGACIRPVAGSPPGTWRCTSGLR